MTTILEEVPGALERPGGCRIQIAEESNGRVRIKIPPRPATPFLMFVCLVLVVNLLLALYTGVMALLFHHSVLLMTQISPAALPLSMQKFAGELFLVLLAMEAIGFVTVAIILRPLLMHETLLIERDWIRHRKRILRSVDEWQAARADVRGFHLSRDPQGLSPSVLTLLTRGEERVIAESAQQADREWLASVGNALLRR